MAIISRNYSLYLYISVLIFTLSCQVAELSERLSAILTMKRSRKLSRSGWRDTQKISILVELIVCQKNVANALNSVEITLKNEVQFVTFPFFYMVELQNFLNAPRRSRRTASTTAGKVCYAPLPCLEKGL